MSKLNPVYLTKEDVQEVADFLSLDFDYCKGRIIDYDSKEFAEAWNRVMPKTEETVRRFYADNYLYIFELTQTNSSKERAEFHGKIIDFLLKNYTPVTHPKVLDYGVGVGTDIIKFAEKGYETSFADIPGKTADFAKYRLKRRNIKSEYIPIMKELPDLKDKYNIIICFDVLEHTWGPIKVLGFLANHLANNGVIAIITCPKDEENHPCHLQRTFLILSKLWIQTLDRVGLVLINNGTGNVYKRAVPMKRFLKKLRYFIWRATSLYIMHMPKYKLLYL